MSEMTKHPKYRFWDPMLWLIWMAMGVFWLMSQLPYRAQLFLGKLLGLLMLSRGGKMVQIAKQNLKTCYPDLDIKQRNHLLRESFKSSGIGIFEAAMAAFATEDQLRPLYHLKGIENLEAAKNSGKGIILLGVHFTTIEIIGRLFLLDQNFGVVYRANRNRVVDYIVTEIIRKHYPLKIERHQVRDLVRALKKGKTIWYTPDIDAGFFDHIYAPFFGVSAASMTAPVKLSKMTDALVVPCRYYRSEDRSGYTIEILPALTDFPSDDMEKDIARINQETENAIREKPEQYIWQYKRFKSRPEGGKKVYKKRKKRENR